MTRLTNAEGATVSVSDEKAKRLLKQGWSPADEPKATAKKAPTKKASSSTTKKS